MYNELGSRMKEHYEHRARYYLPRRTYTVIRCDGRAFHTYTRDLERPFDEQFMDDMITTASFLCREVAGTALAYTQSDEISLILTDFATPGTEAWFNGNVAKMVSIAASLATAKFNQLRPGGGLATFDARAFTIPDPTEVTNYLIWRQQDWTRNSVSMLAQNYFSSNELHGKSNDEMQEMLWQSCGVNWNDNKDRTKRGTVIAPRVTVSSATWKDLPTGKTHTAEAVERRSWRVETPPVFTRDRDYLSTLIPVFE